MGYQVFLIQTLAPTVWVAYVLDLLLGDPEHWPHPVRWIGAMIQELERALLNPAQDALTKRRLGLIPAFLLPASLALFTTLVLRLLYSVSPVTMLIVRTILIYQLLAVGSLARAARRVQDGLVTGTLALARERLSWIVGRDTDKLSAEQVITATVETVAENFSDGVVAPLFFLLLFDLPGMVFYKAVNTLDSMIGYKNERYLDFGRASARLDDVLNYVPSRLAALFMLLACPASGLSIKRGFEVYHRDRNKHSSPNSGQTEAVAAGALGLALGGPNYYGGQLVDKPYIGIRLRPPTSQSIDQIVRLLYLGATGAVLMSLGVRHLLLTYSPLQRLWQLIF